MRVENSPHVLALFGLDRTPEAARTADRQAEVATLVETVSARLSPARLAFAAAVGDMLLAMDAARQARGNHEGNMEVTTEGGSDALFTGRLTVRPRTGGDHVTATVLFTTDNRSPLAVIDPNRTRADEAALGLAFLDAIDQLATHTTLTDVRGWLTLNFDQVELFTAHDGYGNVGGGVLVHL